MESNNQTLCDAVTALAQTAGQAILNIYQSDDAWVKHKDDGSPLTAADMAAHKLIVAGLAEITPDVPVLSEEDGGTPFDERKHWTRYWLVDPLDGTKEFVGKTDEFTVNIALIENGVPVMGVVVAPVFGLTYSAVDGKAWRQKDGEKKPISVRKPATPLVVVASRRHKTGRVAAFTEVLQAKAGETERLDVGSSLKMCKVAEGSADIYPRLGPTSEWDTGAADAVLRAAGGMLCRKDLQPLAYNKEDILNPDFMAINGLEDWALLADCWPD